MTLRAPRLAFVVLAVALFTVPAFAVNKEMVQLQTQIQELQDAIARLQQSNDERMGVMKDLVQQTADSVNKMSVAVATLQKQLSAQQDAQGTKLDQVSSQVQSLNDALDELKARLAHIDRSVAVVQDQQQSINAAMQNNPAGAAPQSAPVSAPPATQDNPTPLGDQPTAPAPVIRPKPSSNGLPADSGSGNPAPPAADLYKTALGDYMGARYALATAEFADVVKFYPDDNLSGNAIYYLGEIDYRAGKYAQAAKDYDKLFAQFPASNKVPAAHLHKGQALIAMKQNEAGIRELRLVVARYPNSPESVQARSKLSGLGVSATPRR